MDLSTYQTPTCFTAFTQVIEVFGKSTASAFGLIRQMALSLHGNEIRLTQDYIAAITKTSKAHYGKAFKELEDWKLLKIERNHVGNIKKYKVFETNFQIFLHFPDFYKRNVDSSKMEYLYTKMKTQMFVDTDLAMRCIENAQDAEYLDIEKVKQNLQRIEFPKDFPKTVTPRERGESDGKNDSLGLSCPPCPRGAKHIDKATIKQHPSDVEDDSDGAVRKRTKLNRRTVVAPKQSVRQQLKGSFAQPVAKSAKRLSAEKIYESRNFIQVKRYWNSLPGLRKIANLEEKENRTLFNSCLTVKALLSGTLLKKGMIDYSGKKVFAEVPKDLVLDEEINVSWLLEKIKIFHQITTDMKLMPRNKTYLRKLSLGEFILGAIGRQERNPSVLFQMCCSPLKAIKEDPNPLLTKQICKQYNLYTEQNREFTGADLQLFMLLGERIMKFASQSDAQRSITMRKGNTTEIVKRFFIAQDQEWRGRILTQTPGYFSGDHAWSVFMKRVEF